MNLEFISSILRQIEGISETSEIRTVGESYRCSFKITVEESEVMLECFIPASFPLELPKFQLETFDVLGFIPHVELNGQVCYLQKESVYTNLDEPEVVFQACVDEVLGTLQRGVKGSNAEDFREEFNTYWERNQSAKRSSVISLIEVDAEPKEIRILTTNQKIVALDKNSEYERLRYALFPKSNPKQAAGLYIPLELRQDYDPPRYDETWSTDTFVDWVKQKVKTKHWVFITETLLRKNPSRFQYVILSIPRTSGETLLIGVKLKLTKSHPFLDQDPQGSIQHLIIKRLDKPSILPRGGADLSLQEKHILLVGCGSVGSHLALAFAQTGVGKLTLVDNDYLNLENLQRYALGQEYSGKEKVEAIKKFLSKNYFYTRVITNHAKVETLILRGSIDLSEYDLIISATGDPTINLYLNRQIREKYLNNAFMVGWNEPLGLGGHSILAVPKMSGCYQCLYKENYNIASFADQHQPKPFHLKHLGCGEVFTPYSALDSLRTSELMARMAVNFFKGKVKQPEIRSWKGDSTAFEEASFNLSTRYLAQNQAQMDERKNQFVNSDCSVCTKSP